MVAATKDKLIEELAEKPDDFSVRSILADWYEDNREPEKAECLRWMVSQKKRPYPSSAKRATWFNQGKISPGLGDVESDIPEELFKLLESGKEAANHRTYDNFPEAEEALISAWKKAKQAGVSIT